MRDGKKLPNLERKVTILYSTTGKHNELQLDQPYLVVTKAIGQPNYSPLHPDEVTHNAANVFHLLHWSKSTKYGRKLFYSFFRGGIQ